MAGRRSLRLGVVHGLIAAAVLVGTGADAFGPARTDSALPIEPAAAGATGESVPPGAVEAEPTGSASPTASSPSTPPPPRPSSPRPSPSKRPAECPLGDRQLEVETSLAQIRTYGAVTVDGRQSPTDCATIRKFQQRFGISPANGKAGATTASVARRIAVSLTAAEQARCSAGAGLMVCVDLTQQTIWVARDGRVVYGPTVTRTGMAGWATPAGTYRIDFRNIKEWSDPFEVWMPYWQHFSLGMGLHETTTYIHNSAIGSHGCVNLLHADARALWSLLGVGTAVRLFGRRPGT